MEWSELKRRREEVKAAYPSLFKVPLVYGTKKQLIGKVLEGASGKALDIGGGDRFAEALCKGVNGLSYKSLDTDDSRFHDFKTIDEIKERFDIILILDVMEHLLPDDGFKMLQGCKSIMNPGGRVVITIPNNNHPTAFSGDCSHITSYRYHELGAMLLSLGFEGLEIKRVCAKKKLKDRLLAALLKPFLRFLDMDFATGILITARLR